MTYKHVDTEEAISYGWMVLSIFLIIVGILYLYIVSFNNMLLDGPNLDQSIGINHDIKEGKMSTQAVNAASFNSSMIKNIPLMLIFGAVIFAISRAIAVKGSGA
jgi:uncharacterized membrane protein SpoIIM required for sporulation